MKIGNTTLTMRVLHRYLGFFLSGVMLMYAVSGIMMIYRNDDTFKITKNIEKNIGADLDVVEIGESIKNKKLKIDRTEGTVMFFENGTYNIQTGMVKYSTKELPYILDKMEHLHKATTKDPLYYLNIFFGLSLVFFVLSSFWMFRPKTKTFKEGLIFTVVGAALVILLLLL